MYQHLKIKQLVMLVMVEDKYRHLLLQVSMILMQSH